MIYANDHDFLISLAYHNEPAARKVFVVNNLTLDGDKKLEGEVVDALVYADAMFCRDMPRLHAYFNARLKEFAVCRHPSQR